MRAQELLWTSASHFETAEFHYYGALARAAALDKASAQEHRAQSLLLMLNDSHVGEIDTALAGKEQEILEV